MLYHRLLAISSVVFENDLMNRFKHPFLLLNKTSTKRITARLFSIDNSLTFQRTPSRFQLGQRGRERL